VNNAPADKFAEHREWASQKRNNAEPEQSARNVEIFQRHAADKPKTLDIFIRKFREIADSMIGALFPVVDKNGKTEHLSGWALPRELATPKVEDRNWDKGLSFAERMAVAGQKVKEQERDKSASVTRKSSTRNDPDL
jgi:hypothetical protein